MFRNSTHLSLIYENIFIGIMTIQEWDDYRENKKDYTGLKIETLNIEDKEEEEEEEEETEVNEVSSVFYHG